MWFSQAPLRWRLSLVTGLVVALSVAAMTLVTFWMVSSSLMATIDKDLGDKAQALIEASADPQFSENIDQEISEFKSYNPGTRVTISPPSWSLTYGDTIPAGGEFAREGYYEVATRTVGNERILVKRYVVDGTTVTLARDMEPTQHLIALIGTMLMLVVGAGVLLAILAGMLVAKTGMQPITRLRRAADYVAQTNDLRPIAVDNDDEIGQLTKSFNDMLAALQDSRIRQSQFVADAGHELKTPLTSMRTNIELLMMLNRAGSAAGISAQDRKDLEDDVMSQMTELSTLIGDLVDSAREDSAEKAPEKVDLFEVLEGALQRARRRRPDVEFRVRFEPWIVHGDQFALGRAMLNLMDNAAKWSPPTGTVRVTLRALDEATARLRIDDSGSGIKPEEREKVFERFYRSAEARSMPGSGLGLAIVKSVIERHDGTISIGESNDGGTRMEITLPGYPGEGEVYVDGLEHGPGGGRREDSASERGTIFAQRWFNQAQ